MLAQMDHTMWTARDGAPQTIEALAQAADGTLWIGSERGLVSFDGRTFRQFESPAGEPARVVALPGAVNLTAGPAGAFFVTTDTAVWAVVEGAS